MLARSDDWEPSAKPDTHREAFARDGVIVARQVFSRDEIDHIRTTFTEQRENIRDLAHNDGVPEDDVLAQYPRYVHPHRHPSTPVGSIALRYIMDERLVKVVESVVGPVYGAQSMYYFKPPGARGQSLHQDNASLRSHPEVCIAAWIAVDDADGNNGGLVVVPGSHRLDLICPEEADRMRSFSSEGIRLAPGVTSHQTELQAGDVLVFHGHLIHGSEPNVSSDRFRQSLIFHYIPQSSKEISKFYQPLLRADGTEVEIGESAEGGPCGNGWEPEA